jgi:hypothetical protein
MPSVSTGEISLPPPSGFVPSGQSTWTDLCVCVLLFPEFAVCVE